MRVDREERDSHKPLTERGSAGQEIEGRERERLGRENVGAERLKDL